MRNGDDPLGRVFGQEAAANSKGNALGGPVGDPVDEHHNGQSAPTRLPGRSTEAGAPRPATRRGVVRRIDAWSVLKLSVVFYITLYCVLLVAAVLLWIAATTTGLRENVESFVADLIASGKFHFVGWELLRGGVVGGAILVVLGTGANVMLAVFYNLISDLVGGLSVVVDDGPARQPAGKRATVAEPEPAQLLIPEAELRPAHAPRPTPRPEPSGL